MKKNMYGRLGYNNNQASDDYDDNDYRAVKVHLPRTILDPLVDYAEGMCLPVSRLISYAIDNELDAPIPFNYLCKEPEIVYVPGAYLEEGQLIIEFLTRHIVGMGVDALMLARRTIGIDDRLTFMLAIRELVESGVASWQKPPSTKIRFKKYADSYRFLVLNKPDKKILVGRKKKILEEIERLQRELGGNANDQE